MKDYGIHEQALLWIWKKKIILQLFTFILINSFKSGQWIKFSRPCLFPSKVNQSIKTYGGLKQEGRTEVISARKASLERAPFRNIHLS